MRLFSPVCTISSRRARLAAGGFLCCAAVMAGMTTARPDEPAAQAIGTISGESIALQGPMKVEVVRGQVRTVLHSGSDVRVKSGAARIDLVEGGQISLCGPAHLSVLKSGGALTVALDLGTIHVRIENGLALTVYTPQILAKPVPIGDSALDALIGLDAAGAMCVRAASGAIRIEQQLTGQTIIVPQGGDFQLTNGQIESLRSAAGHCVCALQEAKAALPEVSMIASAEEAHAKNPQPKAAQPAPEKPAPKEEPVYQVFMPPLSFDAAANAQPEPDPRLIVFVRRVRVRPTLIFRGRVEGEAMAAAVNPPPAATPAPQTPAPAAGDSVLNRVRNFLRKLWTRGS